MARLSYPTTREREPDRITERERDVLFRRADGLKILLLAIFGILTFRLYTLQFLARDRYVADALRNVEKRVILDPVRGRIFDRKGRLLVSSQPYYRLVLDRSWGGTGSDGISPEECRRSLDLVADLLGWDPVHRKEILGLVPAVYRGSVPEEKLSASGYVVLADHLDYPEIILVEEHSAELPGIRIEEREMRRYYQGRLACHLLGYTGPISREDYLRLRKKGYKMNDWVGRDGLERALDVILRGKRGETWQRRYANNLVEEEVLEKRVSPVPGEDCYLSLDSELQTLAENLLEGKKGGIAAVDPYTGQILVLASSPGFDLSLFQGGIHKRDWDTLVNNPDKPLVDRATGRGGGGYPPGSVFKIVTMIAALEEQLVSPETTFHCSGSIPVGRRRKRCHKRSGHGTLDLYEGLTRSCDVYFYHTGELVGARGLAKYARGLGLGRKTGLPEELHEGTGLVPDPVWRRTFRNRPWTLADTLNMAIGQGDLLVTPLQIAMLTAFVANGGSLLKPQILSHRRNSQGELTWEAPVERRDSILVSQSTLEIVREAMRRVVESSSGTGRRARIPGLEIAGKTGTAEHYKKPSDAWFCCFAPFERPEIAIAVVVEGGGHGGQAAAPLARELLLHFFRDRLGKQNEKVSFYGPDGFSSAVGG